MRQMVTDPDASVAIAAAEGLGFRHNDQAGFARLSAIVNDAGVADEQRQAAISALGRIRDSRAAPVLWGIVAMKYPPGFIGPDLEDEYRRLADHALSGLFVERPPEYPAVYERETAAFIDLRRVVREALAGETTSAFAPKGGDAAHAATGYLRRSVEGGGTAAYVMTPAVPYRTGVLGFCGDKTGRICFTRDGTAPRVVDGRCPPSDQPIVTYVEGRVPKIGEPRECRAVPAR